MALLGVGVFANVIISKVTVNNTDQGKSLDVTFKQTGEVPKEDADELDFLNSASVGSSSVGNENNIRLYGIQVTGYDGNPKDGDTLLNEVIAKKDQLTHILSAYLPADQIKWELTKGVDAKGKAELVKQITKESVLNKLVDNIFTQFEAMMKPVVGEDGEKVYVKFLRKSKASNFPRLADRKLDWNPFIANMKDEKLKAKIKFSAWEHEQGFDSNEQSLDGADAPDPTELDTQAKAVNAIFG
jgi:hypothetical protein